MEYVVVFSAIQKPGAPFNAIKQRSFNTLDEAKGFMRTKMERFLKGLSDSPVNDSWRKHGKIALTELDNLTEPEGNGILNPVWTKGQGGVDGKVTFLCPAPSMTIMIR